MAQDPATGLLVDGDVAQQADQIMRNIAATLAAIGKDLDDVIRVGVYLTDMSQFGAMNEAYRRHLAEPYPARTAIGVAACRWARRSRWMWWCAEVSAVDQRHQPRLGAAASCSLAVADVQLAEPAQLPAHVVQVKHADLVDPQADAGLQPRGRAVPRGRDELAAGGQFLAPPDEQCCNPCGSRT